MEFLLIDLALERRPSLQVEGKWIVFLGLSQAWLLLENMGGLARSLNFIKVLQSTTYEMSK